MQAAYAEADITPPLGGSMPGYFKDRQATGTLDPLKAKVLMLRQGDTSVGLVACDLIGMGAGLVGRIRETVVRRVLEARIPEARFARLGASGLWVHCSHTHTGGMVPRADGFTTDAEAIYPGFYQGKVDEKWVDQLVENVARAVVQAASELKEEQRLTLHVGQQKDIAHYRRYIMKDGSVRTNPGRNNPNVDRPAGEIDPRVHILRFNSNRVLMVVYGMHPDCVSGTKYSADYPHHMTEVLRHALGAEWRVIYLNACCGNINHVNVNDARQKSGPDESKRLGEQLALAVLEGLKQEQVIATNQLGVKSTKVMSKLRKPRPEDVVEAEKLLRIHKETGQGNPFGFNELFAPAVVVLAKTKDTEHAAEIVALQIGTFGLAGLPGEIFVELGREVEAASPFKPTRTIGLVNGSMGYIPTARAYAEGGYEAGYRSARYEPDTGHRWAAAAGQLLRELGGK
jgi:hypothetical protein